MPMGFRPACMTSTTALRRKRLVKLADADQEHLARMRTLDAQRVVVQRLAPAGSLSGGVRRRAAERAVHAQGGPRGRASERPAARRTPGVQADVRAPSVSRRRKRTARKPEPPRREPSRREPPPPRLRGRSLRGLARARGGARDEARVAREKSGATRGRDEERTSETGREGRRRPRRLAIARNAGAHSSGGRGARGAALTRQARRVREAASRERDDAAWRHRRRRRAHARGSVARGEQTRGGGHTVDRTCFQLSRR